jgi:hypothetical protein
MGEIQSLTMHHELPTQAKAIKMWHKHIQDKAKDPEGLSRTEKDNKNKDTDHVIKSMTGHLREAMVKRKT